MASHRRSRQLYLVVFCAFAPLLFLMAFFIAPLSAIASLSVSGGDPLAGYRHIFTSPVYLKVIAQTFNVSFWITLICLLLGYPFAYCMTKLPPRAVGVVIAILVLPWWTSVLVRSYAWIVVLSPTGLVNSAVMHLGLCKTPIPLLYNAVGVTIGTAHVLFPFAVLPIYAVIRKIDDRLLLAAQSLGATWVRSFFHVLVPLSLPGIFAGALVVFVQALGFFITPALLGGGKTVLVSMLIQTQVEELLNWKFASALAMLLLLITTLLLLAYQRIVREQRIVVLTP